MAHWRTGCCKASCPTLSAVDLMAAYSFVVVGLSQVVGAFLAGSAANAVGVDWTIAGGAVVVLAYTRWAYGEWPELRRMR